MSGDQMQCVTLATPEARWRLTWIVALIVLISTQTTRIIVVRHGSAEQIVKGVEIAAAIVCATAIFWWAVLHERSRRAATKAKGTNQE